MYAFSGDRMNCTYNNFRLEVENDRETLDIKNIL